ncbi:aminopeptidase [Marinobacteraceae bacterium S3BR75-40.1]
MPPDKRHRCPRIIGVLTRVACLASLLLLTACSELAYYGQAAYGQVALLSDRRPLQAVIDDPETPPAWREALAQIPGLRTFARQQLALPVGDTFDSFVDLDRPYVVWNVLATPPYQVKLRQWCYPIVGCQAYRGYFQRDDARDFARQLEEEGLETWAPGIVAYSTLGWFDDPVLSSFLHLSPDRRSALIFHELAHKVVYVDGDTTFNESFATAVELEGLQRWLEASDASPERFDAALARLRMEDDFVSLIQATAQRLEALYARADQLSREHLDEAKAEIFARLRERYQALKAGWSEPSPYQHFFEGPLNNAKIAVVGQYHQWVPAFRQLLREQNGDFGRFYDAVEALGEEPAKQRSARLQQLKARFEEDVTAS